MREACLACTLHPRGRGGGGGGGGASKFHAEAHWGMASSMAEAL